MATPLVGGAAAAPDHCIEWRTSEDGITWARRGVLRSPSYGAYKFWEPMSVRVYDQLLVLVTNCANRTSDAGCSTTAAHRPPPRMVGFVTSVDGLLSHDAGSIEWKGGVIADPAGANASFVGAGMRILPVDAQSATHAVLAWMTPRGAGGGATSQCKGLPKGETMLFAAFPLANSSDG